MKFIQISVFDPNPVTLWMSEDSFNDTKCCVSKEAFSLKQSSIQQLQKKKKEENIRNLCHGSSEEFYPVTWYASKKWA